MPTYEYECSGCKRSFEVEQKMSDPPIQKCPLPSARTVEDRWATFESAGGAISWNHRPYYEHPDRCVCQGRDPYPHRHRSAEDSDPKHSCARCVECNEYRPVDAPPCGAPVQRLISGSTSFVLKGPRWAKDGY